MDRLRKNGGWIQLLILAMSLFMATPVLARERVINLEVAYKKVCFAGKCRTGIAVNNQIPAPTLHFKQGDHVTINVFNRLHEETAIHWHGLLVPWQMDGVLGVSQKGIRPGSVFHYQFPLLQAGTYWYHSHAALQEQLGLYGAIVIDPPKPSPYHYTKDYVVVLSDWSNTDPEQLFANLKKDGNYYSPRLPLQPSLSHFLHDYRYANAQEKQLLIRDYQMMQTMRMGIYDFSDIAYDAFLLNGRTVSNPWRARVRVGDVVRLRFIGAAANTIFHVKLPNTTMQMVQIDGNDVIPHEVTDFRIAPGETYDVLVTIKNSQPTIIYAASADTLGAAIGALITSSQQVVNYAQVTPFPEPPPVTREMMGAMHTDTASRQMPQTMMHDHHIMGMHHTAEHHSSVQTGMTMQHAMRMPTEPSIIGDTIDAPYSTHSHMNPTQMMGGSSKYHDLKAAVKTNDPDRPIKGIINMELFGYMNRFIWFINGKPEYEAQPIMLEPGQRYRLIFINNSMMHHPMHIHGHWFILRNGHGTYDPLLHTIDVPPGGTIIADIDTDASGQWMFHCHFLYHMFAGMSRILQYTSLIDIIKGDALPQNIISNTSYVNRPIVRVDKRPIDIGLVEHPEPHHQHMYFATLLEFGEDPYHNVQRITYKGLYGYDYNKIELFTNDAEFESGKVANADIDLFYWHLISQFWAVKGGANYFYRPAKKPYWQPGIGIEGLLPYFIETDVRGYYHSGSTKLDIELSRDTQITDNGFLRIAIRSIIASKRVTSAAIGSGLNQMRYIVRPYYRVMPGLTINLEFEHQQDYGSFNSLQKKFGESTNSNTLTVGFSALF